MITRRQHEPFAPGRGSGRPSAKLLSVLTHPIVYVSSTILLPCWRLSIMHLIVLLVFQSTRRAQRSLSEKPPVYTASTASPFVESSVELMYSDCRKYTVAAVPKLPSTRLFHVVRMTMPCQAWRDSSRWIIHQTTWVSDSYRELFHVRTSCGTIHGDGHRSRGQHHAASERVHPSTRAMSPMPARLSVPKQ